MQSELLTPLDQKAERAREVLRELRRVAVAFSAGVDSTLVLKLALDELGADNVVAVTGRSDSVPRDELDEARRLADSLGAEHVFIHTDEFENADYLSNPTNRCYFCKTTLYQHMSGFLEERGLEVTVNGTNADDLGDYRPGLQAATEHEVRSPLAEAGLTKLEIRELSRQLGLPTHDKPAGPCLSSRVQYGEPITPEKLRRIEAAEACLRRLGFRECRVRHHENLARIEIAPELFARITEVDIAQTIRREFRSLGYLYVTLDLQGFRSGSLNEVIAFGKRQRGS